MGLFDNLKEQYLSKKYPTNMALKITKGKCVALGNHIMIEGTTNKIAVCMMKRDNLKFNAPDPEMEANASLIAEAFNVANETGLSPRELVAQRDELIRALKEFAEMDVNNCSLFYVKEKAQAAIKKVTT